MSTSAEENCWRYGYSEFFWDQGHAQSAPTFDHQTHVKPDPEPTASSNESSWWGFPDDLDDDGEDIGRDYGTTLD